VGLAKEKEGREVSDAKRGKQRFGHEVDAKEMSARAAEARKRNAEERAKQPPVLTEEEEILDSLRKQAKGGNVQAAKLVLDYEAKLSGKSTLNQDVLRLLTPGELADLPRRAAAAETPKLSPKEMSDFDQEQREISGLIVLLEDSGFEATQSLHQDGFHAVAIRYNDDVRKRLRKKYQSQR